jgi:Uma2 family endonuclease
MSDPARIVPLTAEDLPYLAAEEGHSELVAGDLVREPPPGEEHGWLAGAVFGHLFRFVWERRLGRMYAAETGFVLARDPDTVRAPDAAFVSAARVAGTARRGPYFEGAPDLAVEVVSPGDSRQSVAAKVREYLAAGGNVVWVVDPRERSVTVHRKGGAVITLTVEDTLDGAPVLPGFQLPVRAIFEP